MPEAVEQPPAFGSFEQRVQKLEDRWELNDLVTKYALLLDDAQWSGLGQLFTEDAVFASPTSSTTGRENIVRNFQVKHDPFPVTWHDPHAMVVDFNGENHARGTVIAYAELAQPGATVATSIRYHDEYRREDGRWRFARRFVLSLYAMPLIELVSGGMAEQDRKKWPGRLAERTELPDFNREFGGYPG